MDLSHRDRSLGTVDRTQIETERAGATGLATYAPGVAAGVAGLVVFLSVHAILILPIWFVAPLGLVAAVIGGIAVNWAYRSVEPHLPASLGGRWLALAGGAILVLVPSLVVAWAGEPYFTVVDGVRRAAGDVPTIAARFVVEFLLVTTLSGATFGWVVTRSRRGALAVAVAALAFALGPGHNLPFFHLLYAPAPAATGLLLTLATILAASTIFVLVDHVVTRPGS